MNSDGTFTDHSCQSGGISREILLLISLSLIFAAGSALLHPAAPSWSADELAAGEVNMEIIEGWEDEFLWVDSRSREDYEEAHIPGALLLNEDDWDNHFFDFLDHWIPGRKVVVYCGSQGCRASHQVAERLRNETREEEIYVLHGGWATWRNQRR